MKPIRLLIIDDSAYNRRTIASFFENIEGVEVLKPASNGQEGLEIALTQKPTIVTLDLEMPKMDGFSFLRLLMANNPLPVIVISSHTSKETIFKALELGALDFIAKPTTHISKQILNIRKEVVEKVLSANKYNPSAFKTNNSLLPPPAFDMERFKKIDYSIDKVRADKLIVIGASTGGPAALSHILQAIPANLNAAIIIAQHMPPAFTETFAKRLDNICPIKVVEVTRNDFAHIGHAYIAPGGYNLIVRKEKECFRIMAVQPLEEEKYRPSVNKLFESAAQAAGDKVMGVVLTGMGDDGALGSAQIEQKGGSIWVESQETAIVSGMPDSALKATVHAKVRPLNMIAPSIIGFAGKK